MSDSNSIENSSRSRDEILEMKFFNSSTLCCLIVFVSNIILAEINHFTYYSKYTYFIGCIILLIVFFAGNFAKTKKERHAIIITFCIVVNVIIFPLLYIFSGGIHSSVAMYFIFGIVFTILLLNKKQLYLVLTLEAFAQFFVLALSYFKPEIVEYFMVINEERYAAVAIGSVITGLAIGVVLRIMVKGFEDERFRVNTLVDELEDITTRDVLTGTYNRRHLMSYLDSCKTQVNDQELQTFSIIMYDLDHFKAVNDTYGHVVGDEVLMSFAKILRKNLRDNDVLARYGGEEFIIVLPDATDVSSFRRAEQIRSHVEETKLSSELKSRVTVSGGICEYQDGLSSQKMIEYADKNLYIAKETGRNKVVWKEGAESPTCYSVFR